MKVVVYLEPAVFRADPLFLSPWAGWLAQIAKANERLELTCVTNRLLANHVRELAGTTRIECIGLAQRDAVVAFDFDRVAYARDLFAEDDTKVANAPLLASLASVAERVRPDVVLSFSENRYLKPAFGSPVLFTELGPLSRSLCAPSFFYDPVGHQTPNLLTRCWPRIVDANVPDHARASLASLWEHTVRRPTLEDPRSQALARHLHGEKRSRKLVLFALQPEDWLTYEGLHPAVSLTDLVMAWASRLPSDWAAVVTYHPAQRLPARVEGLLADEHNNLVFLPDDLASGSSEFALPHVDAIAAISSSVGMQALLWRKARIAMGRGSSASLGVDDLRKLDEARPLGEAERVALLFFLTNRFCQPSSRVLDEPGYFSGFLDELACAGFSDTAFLDPTTWRESNARALLSVPTMAPTIPSITAPAAPVEPPTIRVYVGTDDSQVVAHQVLEYSIRKHTRRRVEYVPIRNIPVPIPNDPAKRPRTGFSFHRFLIPQLAGYQGRAIYLDADMLVVADIAELFDMDLGGKSVLCTNHQTPPIAWRDNPHFHPGLHLAVMLLDCDRLRWNIHEIVGRLEDGKLDYADLMMRLRILPEEEIGDHVPLAWNSLERYVPGETKLVHYTVVSMQPWKCVTNPNERVWLRYYRDAIRVGFVNPEDVRRGLAQGYLHPRLGAILEDELARGPIATDVDADTRRLRIEHASLASQHADTLKDLERLVQERAALREQIRPTNYARSLARDLERKARTTFARLRRRAREKLASF